MITKVISNWYHGEIKVHEPPFVGVWQERHWTSRFAHAVVDFHTKEWKWALPFYVALLGLGLRLAGAI